MFLSRSKQTPPYLIGTICMLLVIIFRPNHFDGSYTIIYAPTVAINREIDDLRDPRRAVLHNPFIPRTHCQPRDLGP